MRKKILFFLCFLLILPIYSVRAENNQIYNGDGTYNLSTGDSVIINNGAKVVFEHVYNNYGAVGTDNFAFNEIRFDLYDPENSFVSQTEWLRVGSNNDFEIFQNSGETNGVSVIYNSGGGEGFNNVTITSTVIEKPELVIANLNEFNITQNSATITWTTNNNSNTWVNYGKTTSYGLAIEVDNQSSVTEHSATLNYLDSNTKYYYQVSSRDESSSDPTTTATGDFTTENVEQSNINISNVQIENLSNTSVKISWSTDVLSNTWVNYGKTTSYGLAIEVDNQSSATEHSATLNYLDSNTEYYYQLSSRNETTDQRGDKSGSFLTSEPSIPGGVLLFSNIEIPNKYMNDGNAKILWNTNIPAPYYEVQWYEIDSDEEYWHSAGGDYFEPRSSHRVILGDNANWKLQQGYSYMIKVCNSVKVGGAPECSEEQQITYKENMDISAKQIADIEDKANYLNNNQLDQILAELKELRDLVREQNVKIKYLERLTKNVDKLSEKMENAINNFIAYGVDSNTHKLGEGERAAVMYSYKNAFNKLPETESELADTIKIANGRWPSVTSAEAEKKAKEQFQKIYKRIADMNDPKDDAAITVMAYGLRQKAENRNLNSEKNGINIFKGLYGHVPQTTEEWNIMQAITYSGASRGVDSDGDLLIDSREQEIGTDPKNKDTDGDGHIDGVEVATGFDPLKK